MGKKVFLLNPKLSVKGEGGLLFVEIGAVRYYKPAFNLWLSEKLLESYNNNLFLQFPVEGLLIKTKSGVRMLIPSEKHLTHYVEVNCGFRGSSQLILRSVKGVKEITIEPFKCYKSELGSLGVSEGALVCIRKEDKVLIEGRRGGRLYGGSESGLVIIEGKDVRVLEGLRFEEYLDLINHGLVGGWE